MVSRKSNTVLRLGHERVICGFVHFAVMSVYLFEFFVILPRIYGDGYTSYPKLAHIFTGTYILINLFIAYWKFLLTDSSAGSVVLPSSLNKGWFYCWSCESNAPPRSYHCH